MVNTFELNFGLLPDKCTTHKSIARISLDSNGHHDGDLLKFGRFLPFLSANLFMGHTLLTKNNISY